MISIIVPIYNAEKYLHRCIDSILAQSYTDFELLLINDGSPDGSGAICDSYAAKDSRVRIFHKENGGVSSARNFGIEQARGEWITFIDADDWVSKDFLQYLVGAPMADFIIGGYVCISGNLFRRNNKRYIGDGIVELINQERGYILRTVWGKLFRSDLIRNKDIKFNENIRVGEDSIFVYQYLVYCNSVQIIDKCEYNYYDGLEPNYFSKKYTCSLQEIDYSLSKMKYTIQDLSNRFHVSIDFDFEVKIYAGMYKLAEINNREAMHKYYLMYAKYASSLLSEKDFFESPIFSPIINGIAILKRLYEENCYEEVKTWWNILYKISHFSPCFLKFPWADFYLCYFFIRKGYEKTLYLYLKIYLYVKRLFGNHRRTSSLGGFCLS